MYSSFTGRLPHSYLDQWAINELVANWCRMWADRVWYWLI